MNMKRKLNKIFAFTATLALSGLLLCSCGTQAYDGKGIASIEKTGSEGLTDVYTITYTDGTTDTFTIKNGADGKDLEVEVLYEAYLEQYPNATYEEFLSAVLSVNANTNGTVVNNALLSSFKVYTEFTESYRSGWNNYITDTAMYTGAAVVYSIDSDYTYLITNYHVIYDPDASTESKIAKKITCYLYGSESEPYASGTDASGLTAYEYGEYAIECTYVGGCAAADIAVVKAETADVLAINENVKAVAFAENYQVGQTAIAIGNPNGEGISVTEGVVSVDNELIQLSVDGTVREYRSIRIDTALYGGNSGGGLFNAEGKLIGIANAGNGDDQNINYAIPLNIVKNVTESIVHYGARGLTSVKKITLGVTVRSENSQYVYDVMSGRGKITEDVVIEEITVGSIAEKIGLKAEDIILSIVINQTEYEIDRYFDIGDLLYCVREGDEISVKYERGGAEGQTNGYTVQASNLSVVV